jgi:hypothetical protein
MYYIGFVLDAFSCFIKRKRKRGKKKEADALFYLFDFIGIFLSGFYLVFI